MNTAARMCKLPGPHVRASAAAAAAAAALPGGHGLREASRGVAPVKGKGALETSFSPVGVADLGDTVRRAGMFRHVGAWCSLTLPSP